MTGLRAGNYGRQSAGNATSVADQHQSNGQVIDDRGWIEIVRYSDLVSASRFGKKPRDDWPKLNADVLAGNLDVVVMWDLSRGDRTVASWAGFVDLCRKKGVLVHATTHDRTYDPRIPRDWRTLMDEGVEAGYDSEKKSVDVRRGTAGAARAGKPHGRVAYGYTRKYDESDRTNFKDVKNEEEASIVREIISRCAREEPIKNISDDLNARGIPSPHNAKWAGRTIRVLATHPRYIGFRVHRGALHPAVWPPLVDRKVFDRAVAVLSTPRRKQSAPASKKYLLSYLAISKCGGGMNVRPPRKHHHAMYACVEDGCTAVRMDLLDDYLTRLVLRRLAQPDARHLFMPPDGQTAEIEAEIAALEARLAEARESFASPFGISAAALASLEHAVQPLLDEARQRQRALSTNAAGLELLGDGPFTAEVAEPRWAALPLTAKRSVMKGLFELIQVGPPVRTLTRWSPDEDRRLAVVERTRIKWR